MKQNCLKLNFVFLSEQYSDQTEKLISHTDLVEFTENCDEQAEWSANREWRAVVPLFSAPFAILESVGNHITRVTVIPWVNVKSNVCIGPGTTLQIYMEPGKNTEVIM